MNRNDKIFFYLILPVILIGCGVSIFLIRNYSEKSCLVAGGETYFTGRSFLCLTKDGRIIRNYLTLR